MLRILMLPLILSVALAHVTALGQLTLSPGRRPPLLFCGVGFAVGLMVVSLAPPFLRAYVLGHELSHWLAAKLFRRRTRALHVGGAGGSIQVERPNVWIVLAPYFVPFYAVVWVGVGVLLRLWRPGQWWQPALYGGLGFAYAYHLVVTVAALSREQHDLERHGKWFSLALIVMVNAGILYWSLAVLNGSIGRAGEQLWRAFGAQIRLLAGAWRMLAP